MNSQVLALIIIKHKDFFFFILGKNYYAGFAYLLGHYQKQNAHKYEQKNWMLGQQYQLL